MDFSHSTDDVTCSTSRAEISARRAVRLRRDVGNHRHGRRRQFHFRQFRLQFRLRAGHERRVIRAGDRQRQWRVSRLWLWRVRTALAIFSASPEITSWPGQFRFASTTPASAQTSRVGASSRPMTAAMPPRVTSQASCMNLPRWRTTRRPSSKLIAPAAVSAVNSPSDKPAVASNFSVRRLFLEQLKATQLTRKIPGCAFSVLVSSASGPLKQMRGEVVAERGVGAVEPRFGGRKFFGQVFAHADDLRALSGKQECGFAHPEKFNHKGPKARSRNFELCAFGPFVVQSIHVFTRCHFLDRFPAQPERRGRIDCRREPTISRTFPACCNFTSAKCRRARARWLNKAIKSR